MPNRATGVTNQRLWCIIQLRGSRVIESRRLAIFGGLLAGLGLVLGVFGGASAIIETLGADGVHQACPIGWDLVCGTAGGLALGLGVAMMVASTIR